MDISKIGGKIKSRRTELNMSQKELAKQLNVSNQLISKWETGESIPSLEYLDSLCKALKIQIKDLLDYNNVVQENNKFDRKNEKLKNKNFYRALIYSIVIFVSVCFVVGFSLLLHYTIIPAATKTKSLAKVDQSIQTALDRGFYNVEFIDILDDEQRSKIILQGYIDENNDVCFYNSKTGEITKDNITSNSSTKCLYLKPSDINNLSDLFANQLSTLGDDNSLTFDDLKYIRKTSKGYYYELSKEFFTKDYSSSYLKNIKILGKIKGNIVIKENEFKSMDINIRIKNKLSKEIFTFKSIVNFINEKPTIVHSNLDSKIWNLISSNPSQDQFINNLSTTSSQKLNMEESIGSRLISEQTYTTDGHVCLFSDDDLIYLNEDDLSVSDHVTFIKGKEKKNNLTYENGYIYSIDNETVTIYNENLSIDKTITLPTFRDGDVKSTTLESVYLYQGNIYYFYERDYFWFRFESYNILNETETFIAQFYFRESSLKILFNGKYAYWNAIDGSDYGSYGYVYDITTKKRLNKTSYYLRYTDSKGNLYLTKDKYSYDLYFNNKNNALEKTGEFKETEDFVFVNYYNSCWYKYENGILIETITATKDKVRFDFENLYCNSGDTKIYNNNGEIFTSLSSVSLCGRTYYADNENYQIMKIVGVYNQKILVAYCPSKYKDEISYLGYYSLDDLSKPIEFIDVNNAIIKIFTTKTLICIKQSNGENSYYLIQ